MALPCFACLQHVSGKLSRHVMTKRDQLLQGINTVASVDYDLKAAFAITKGGRASLKVCRLCRHQGEGVSASL